LISKIKRSVLSLFDFSKPNYTLLIFIATVVAAIFRNIQIFLVTSSLLVLSLVLNDVKNLKGRKQSRREQFKQAGEEASNRDWLISEDIAEKSNYNKENLKFVEEKISHLIEKEQDRAEVTDDKSKIASTISILIILSLCILNFPGFLPYVASYNNINDIKMWSVALSFLLACIGCVATAYKFFAASDTKDRVDKFKECLSLLKQTRTMIDYIQANKKITQHNEHYYIVKNDQILGGEPSARE